MTGTPPRNDAHRPVNMDPVAYGFRGAFDRQGSYPGDSPAGAQRIALIARLVASPTSRWGEDHYGQCDHCGAHLRYVAVLEHEPTGDAIAVGETCLDNRFSLESKAQFDALREAAQLDREAQRLRKAYDAFLEAVPGLAEAFAAEGRHEIVSDIARKLRRYGSISENQVALVFKLERERVERLAAEAARAVEVTVPAPEGRYEIVGTVVSRKTVDSFYGLQFKMLVRVDTPEGAYRIWSTVPAALVSEAERGDVVRFTATVERSHDDESFAFASRPTKASFVEEAAAA